MGELSVDLTKEERREQKRKLREAEDQRLRLKKLVKKTVYILVAILVVFGIVRWITNQFPKGQDYSVTFPVLGRDHIYDGSARPDYNSNPPTSGPHYATPATVRFYSQELSDEQLVHNLEHGHIWVSYKPDLASEIIKVLRGFAGRNTIVTPRSANDFDIALAAWGRLDKFNLVGNVADKQRIRDFVLRYQNSGPEKVNLPQHIR
ncbi:MAG: DUF3105 domain-containing protein [Candidatus Harrisonbacteria bacterium]|nr:DUF3105 domain-containing protein [Candidatus Harrisonbacteria bacterium]